MTDLAPEKGNEAGGRGTNKRVSRATLARCLIAASIIAAGVVAMQVVEKAFHLTFDKPPMPLQMPLDQLSRTIGDPPRYVAAGVEGGMSDSSMSEDILEVLGTRDYLLRRYVDNTLPETSPVAALHLNLNYYATGGAFLHVPEICWAGNGMVEAEDSRHIFEIPNVRRRDGRVVNLYMNMISFRDPQVNRPDHEKNVAYMFAVNGDYVATPEEVTSRFWKASNKHAYDTKIEVTAGDDGQYCTQAEAQAAISAFIRAALPEIEACLPDPNADAPGKSSAASAGTQASDITQ